MIALLASAFVSVVFGGGFVAGAGFLLLGLGATAMGSIGLGLLFAIAATTYHKTGAFDTREGLTVRQLKHFLGDTSWITDDAKLYVRDQNQLLPATHLFSCLLDGGKSVVIERVVEKPNAHDLF